MRKISVIIPCYNVERWIDRCMMSIEVQTIGMEELEIICIDDASTDNTWNHLKKWKQRYPEHIVLIRQEVNKRQGAARNIGLQYASAEWIAFIDADDWLESDCLEQLYTPIVQYDCDVSFCDWTADMSDLFTCFEKDDAKKAEGDFYGVADTEEKKKKWIGRRVLGDSVCGKIIRKSIIFENKIFFPEELAYEDMYWVPLLHVYVKSAYKVGKKMYHYFVGDNSTVRSKNSDHHIDWITIQLMKWNDYQKRGLLEKYRTELEQDALNDAVCFMKMLTLQYDRPPFSLFLLERELIGQYIPKYQDNLYLANCTEIFSVLLEALYCPLNKSEFQMFVTEAKKYWGE